MTQHTQQKSSIHPVAAGLVGAATVAAGVAAVVLSKKENREKVSGHLQTLKKKGDTLAGKAAKVMEDLGAEKAVRRSVAKKK